MTLWPRLAALGLILLLGSGCPVTGDQPLALTADQQTPALEPPTPPPGLLAHVRVGPLPRVLEDAATAGQRLGLTQVKGSELWTLLREVLGVTTDLADVVDWKRPAHLLVLDPAQHRLPVAALLPARQPDLALGRLAARCRAHRRGALWIFTGGGQALLPCRFAARSTDRALLVAPDAKTLRLLWRFALQTAQQDTGAGPALRARVFARTLLRKLKFDAKKLDQLAKVGALGLSLAGGDLDDAPRIEAQLTRLFGYLRSARDVGLELHLDRRAVRVRLFATAASRGSLRRWIESRRPPRLAGLGDLPPRAAVALSLAPGTKAPKKDTGPGLLARLLLTQLPASLRKPVGQLLARLSQTGARFALVGRAAGGLCVVGVLQSPTPGALRAGLTRTVTQTLAGLAKHLGGSGKRLGLSPPQQRGPVQVRTIDLGGSWPAARRPLQLALQLLAGGDKLTWATATRGRRLVMALGADASGQALRTLTRSQVRGGPWPPLPPGRLGLVRLSLVELARVLPWLSAGLPLPNKPAGALTAHWGVRPRRLQVDASLRLPLDHLLSAAPLWRSLLARLESRGRALSGLAPPTGPEPDDDL